jgi:hypothetical protein
MEGFLQQIGGDGKENCKGDAADGKDAGIRKVGKEMENGPADRANDEKREHAARHQSCGRRDEACERREKGDGAEHEEIAAQERLAGEQPGKWLGQWTVRLPDEQIQKQPADKDSADHCSEQHRA